MLAYKEDCHTPKDTGAWAVALVRGIARALGVGVDHLIAMFTDDDDSEREPTNLALAGA
jgi:hypothetical protein